MQKTEIQEWLISLVRGLVTNPDAVEIESKSDDMGTLFTLSLDQKDAGKIIGRGGETIRAVRTLLRITAYNYDVRASLKVDIPEKPSEE